jgi:hypothetical protein
MKRVRAEVPTTDGCAGVPVHGVDLEQILCYEDERVIACSVGPDRTPRAARPDATLNSYGRRSGTRPQWVMRMDHNRTRTHKEKSHESDCEGFVVGTLGLAGLLIHAGYVHPAPVDTQESCADKGYVLCSDGKCGSRTCGGEAPGSTKCTTGRAGRCYMCDGCTSTWIEFGRSDPNQPGLKGIVPPAAVSPQVNEPPAPSGGMKPQVGTVTPGLTR